MLLCSKSRCRSECVFSYWEKGDAVVELGLHPPSPVRAIWSCLVDFVAIVVQESGLFVVSCPSLKAPSEWTSWCLRVISQKGARKWIPPPPGSPASVQPLVSGNSARTKSGINMWSQGHFYEEPNLPWESAEKPLNCSANSNSRSCLRPTIEIDRIPSQTPQLLLCVSGEHGPVLFSIFVVCPWATKTSSTILVQQGRSGLHPGVSFTRRDNEVKQAHGNAGYLRGGFFHKLLGSFRLWRTQQTQSTTITGFF